MNVINAYVAIFPCICIHMYVYMSIYMCIMFCILRTVPHKHVDIMLFVVVL